MHTASRWATITGKGSSREGIIFLVRWYIVTILKIQLAKATHELLNNAISKEQSQNMPLCCIWTRFYPELRWSTRWTLWWTRSWTGTGNDNEAIGGISATEEYRPQRNTLAKMWVVGMQQQRPKHSITTIFSSRSAPTRAYQGGLTLVCPGASRGGWTPLPQTPLALTTRNPTSGRAPACSGTPAMAATTRTTAIARDFWQVTGLCVLSVLSVVLSSHLTIQLAQRVYRVWK